MNVDAVKDKNVFSNVNYRLVFFGALVSELGAVLYSFAVSFYILEVSGNNAFLQGLYLALCGAVLLLFTPIGGVLGDRYRKARIMVVCDCLKGGIIAAAAALMLIFRGNTAHITILFAAGICGNAVSGVFEPAAGALLPEIVEDGRLQQANAYFSVKSALTGIFGIAAAGVLYASMSVYALFFSVGVCYVLSGVSEAFIRYEHKTPEGRLTVKTALADMKTGFTYVRSRRALMTLMAAILFINFFMTPVYGNFMPYFIKTDIAGAPSYLFDRILTPEMWSSVFGVLIGIASVAGAMTMSGAKQQDKCGVKTAVRLSVIAALMIAFTAAYALTAAGGRGINVFLILFCGFCLMFGFILSRINVPLNTVIMRTVDKDKLSKVNGILSVLSQGITPVASVLAGAVLQALGTTPLLAVCSAGFAASALFLLFSKQTKNI